MLVRSASCASGYSALSTPHANHLAHGTKRGVALLREKEREATMTDTYSTGTSSGSNRAYPASGGEHPAGLDQARDTYDKAPDIASRARDAEQVASDAASSLRDEVRRVLDRQVNHGAEYLGQAASSIRTAADELSKNAPPLGALASTVADRLDSYAQTVKGKTVEDLWRKAADFTRRQPALVFGLASLTGFLAYRTIKNTKPASSTSTGVRNPAKTSPGN